MESDQDASRASRVNALIDDPEAQDNAPNNENQGDAEMQPAP